MSMDTQNILDKYSYREGWSEATQLELLIEYIDNQYSSDAFRDFLEQKVLEDQEAESNEED